MEIVEYFVFTKYFQEQKLDNRCNDFALASSSSEFPPGLENPYSLDRVSVTWNNKTLMVKHIYKSIIMYRRKVNICSLGSIYRY